jgi:phasin family protein
MVRVNPIIRPMLHCNMIGKDHKVDGSSTESKPLFIFLIGKTMLTPEQILAAHKANVETVFGLTAKAFAGVEKLVELNVTAAKAALADASETTQAALSVKDAQQLLALQAGLMQPLAEKAASYSRHLYDIASGTGAEFGKAFEAQSAEGQKKFMGLVDSATQNAPAGSEAAVAVMKNAVAAANNAFESVQKAVKQATEAAESNFNSMASTAMAATKTATAAAKKR